MAKYGAKYIKWAPFAASDPEPADSLPRYGTPISLGALVKVTDSPVYNEGKQYGDDVLKEYVNEFKECGIDVEITEMSNAVASAILGATLASGDTPDISFKDSDSAPYGGFGFVVCKQINNVKKYQGVYYPKTKAAMQGDEYTTKGDGVTLTGGKLKLTAAVCNSGEWKVMSDDLSTEAAAKTWVDAKVVVYTAPSGG